MRTLVPSTRKAARTLAATALLVCFAPGLSSAAHADDDVHCGQAVGIGSVLTPSNSAVVTTHGNDLVAGTGVCISVSGASFEAWVDIKSVDSAGNSICTSGGATHFPSVAGVATPVTIKPCGQYDEPGLPGTRTHYVYYWVHNSQNPTSNEAAGVMAFAV